MDTSPAEAAASAGPRSRAVIGRSWDNVVDAIDEVITIPDVDKAASEKAAAELEEPKPEPEEIEEADETEADDVEGDDADAEGEDADETSVSRSPPAAAGGLVLGADEDFWLKVGIDPIQMMTRGGTFYTLRCYLDDAPVFLGRNGRVSVFGSERSLARYLADEHDHDLSDLATYEDIKTAATDGSLRVDVTDDNVYVTSGLADDIADGPDAVDRDQLELAVELLRDVGEYSEDDIVEETLDADMPLGGWSPTCWTPTRSASPPRRTPRRSSSGSRWRRSWSHGCARSSPTFAPRCNSAHLDAARSTQEYRFFRARHFFRDRVSDYSRRKRGVAACCWKPRRTGDGNDRSAATSAGFFLCARQRDHDQDHDAAGRVGCGAKRGA